MGIQRNRLSVKEGMISEGICEAAAEVIITNYHNFFLPNVFSLIHKMLPVTQANYAKIIQQMHFPANPGMEALQRLQSICSGRPSLLMMLKQYPPININLATLIEVLDTLRGPGVADSDIKTFLSNPSTNWKTEISRNQSAGVDPTAASHRADLPGL